MTPPDDLTDAPVDADELAVHAVLDGEADADQRRRVARDPALVARVAALRTAGEALAAPVEPPPASVLAALRSRAIDAGLAGDDPVDATPAAGAGADVGADADHPPADPAGDDGRPTDVATTDPATPAGAADDLSPGTDELAPRRARRRRRLPPLPAVAAVVFLLVLVGSALILTDGRGDDDAATDAASAPTEQADDAGAAESAAGADGAVDPAVAEARARLSAAASTAYGSEAELLDALRSVDPATLDLSGTGAPVARSGDAAGANDEAAPEEGDDVPLSGDAPEAETTTSVAGTLDPTDPDVERCYTVLRSITPTLGPTEAAAIVLVDDVPVLVLSNPVGASEEEQASTRLSTVDAVSCVPGDAVQR